MIVGFNTDVKYRTEVFHVQTEDKGEHNPTIETLVYLHGEILLSRRLSYSSLAEGPEKQQKIRTMMKTQHDQVIGELKSGNFSHLLSMETQIIDEKPLDEMVLNFFSANPS